MFHYSWWGRIVSCGADCIYPSRAGRLQIGLQDAILPHLPDIIKFMDPAIPRAGFVLVGGKSSRMGQDKAGLPLHGKTMAEHVAAAVAEAAGSTTLIGPPDRYSSLGFPVIADARPGLGPLGGIHTALTATPAAWNLIAACDLPAISPAFLKELMSEAEASGADCLIPAGPSGRPEPLCAAYHSRCRESIGAALDRNIRKVTDGLTGLRVVTWRVGEIGCFQNVNTPQEWTQYLNG
jgi:molybdenum cofactor guanylyltransferase